MSGDDHLDILCGHGIRRALRNGQLMASKRLQAAVLELDYMLGILIQNTGILFIATFETKTATEIGPLLLIPFVSFPCYVFIADSGCAITKKRDRAFPPVIA